MKKLTTIFLSFIISYLTLFGNNLSTTVFQRWSTDNNSWVNSTRENFITYDQNDNLTYKLTEQWEVYPNSWFDKTQSNFFYNLDGTKAYSITQEYDSNTSSWKNKTKRTYTYNSNNLIETEVFENWTNNQWWQNSTKRIYTYNQNSNLISMIMQNFDLSSQSWINNIQITYEYNSNETRSLLTVYYWNVTTNSWDNNSREYSLYENENILYPTSINGQTWDSNSNSWKQNPSKTYFYYDNNWNKTKEISMLYNVNLNLYENVSQTIYTYTSNGELFEEIHQLADRYNKNNWVNSVKYTHTYMINTKIDESNIHNNDLHPNVIIDNLGLSIINNGQDFQFLLYDLNGRLLISRNISESFTSINLNELPSNIYTLQTICNGIIKTTKVRNK